MSYDSDIHRRRSVRLSRYDYSIAGAYFITVVIQDRVSLLGEIVNGCFLANALGNIVAECWREIPNHFPNASLDAFIVMPNHVHGILFLESTVPKESTPTDLRGEASHIFESLRQFGNPRRGTISTIVGSFKAAATKQINQMRGTPSAKIWQRNFHDHVIRNEKSLNRIRGYIENNPVHWASDPENLLRTEPVSKPPWDELCEGTQTE